MQLIDRDALEKKIASPFVTTYKEVRQAVKDAPTVDAVQVVRCADCKWWDKKDESPYGYCMAMKHGFVSSHWEIGIYRTYKGDFYCADGERRKEDE